MYNCKYSRRTFPLQILINSPSRLRSRIPNATSNWWCRKCSPEDFGIIFFVLVYIYAFHKCSSVNILLFLYAFYECLPDFLVLVIKVSWQKVVFKHRLWKGIFNIYEEQTFCFFLQSSCQHYPYMVHKVYMIYSLQTLSK